MTEVNREGTGKMVSYPQYCTPVGIASDAILQAKLPQGVKRWIALDLSKQSCWICVLDAQGMVLMHESHSLAAAKRSSLLRKFCPGDLVIMEASTGTFALARALNARDDVMAVVINTNRTELNKSKKKTDREDSLWLARVLLRTPLAELPLVSIPTDEEMDERNLVSLYHTLTNEHAMQANRLHALFHTSGNPQVSKEYAIGTKDGRRQAIGKYLSNVDLYAAKTIDMIMRVQEERIEQLQKKLAGICKKHDAMAMILFSLPGVSTICAATIIAYANDIMRFHSGKQFAAYCGLVPKVNQSGQRDAKRKISKEGQSSLRKVLVEAVYAILRVKANTPFHQKYRALRKRGLPGRKAAVAVARKLAQTIYALLRNGELYTLEDEQEQESMDAYYARKRIKHIGLYKNFGEKVKQHMNRLKTLESITSRELAVT